MTSGNAGMSSGAASGNTASGGSASSGGASGLSGGRGAVAGAPAAAGGMSGAGAAGSAGMAVGGAAGGGGDAGAPVLSALGANGSVGLEWNAIAGAEAYRIRFALGGPVSASDPALEVTPPRETFVHRGLANGTEVHYLVTAVVGGAESPASNEAVATPNGEWALEEFGSGTFEDVSTGQAGARVPLEDRIHVLLLAEGYTADDLPVFHSDESHDDDRGNDVDRWVDEVFEIAPYSSYREAFVVWYLPRASNTHFDGGDTAFAVPVSGGAVTGSSSTLTETATRLWAAIDEHPVPPDDFSGGGFGTVRTHVAAFITFDAERGRAGLSGITTSLRDPDNSQARIPTAFAMGHAHEFTHAFSGVRDEYLEDDNQAPGDWDELSNVVGTNVCGELPWSHLIAGGTFNPSTDELVGAFGRSTHGFHSELLCLMNGTHDNATYYGGGGTLRPNDRLCNYCRELTAFYIYARTSRLSPDTTGFDAWKSSHRTPYYAAHPFYVPEVVPQTNNVQNPSQGDAVFEACAAASQVTPLESRAGTASGRRGCVVDGG
jgi:hypothetical protein